MSKRTNKQENRLIREFVDYATDLGFRDLDPDSRQPLPLEVSARFRISEIKRKLKTDDVDLSRMKWDYAEPGPATTTHHGETTEYFVPPEIYLVGEAVTKKGTTLFYKKFVSHPFYQHGRTIIPNSTDQGNDE